MQARMSRRTFLEVAGGVSLTTMLTGCFGVGSSTQTTTSSSNGATTITLWDGRAGAQQATVAKAIDRFNQQQSKIHVASEFFQNDPYKQKLQVAMGAHNPPDIFYGWGGGGLKTYVDANDAYDLTDAFKANSAWQNRFFPSVLEGGKFNGKYYAVPCSGVQPVVFFYNKELFNQYHITVPQTWSALLSSIATLKQHNIIPIALAGSSKWPYLMYEEYLVDRFGGPSAFDAVFANQSKAWSNEAFIKANTAIQQLVSAGAFGANFASVVADTNQDTALLTTGKAAMQLMGSWNFSTILANSPDFIQSGKLGWFSFPTVDGGQGDVNNIAGNLSNFYSISATAKSSQDCITYLKDGVLNDAQVADFIAEGDVPPVQNIEAQLAKAPHSAWQSYIYKLVQHAPHFQLSWDQALSAQPAQALLTNLDQLFLQQITPQQFSDNMNKTISA